MSMSSSTEGGWRRERCCNGKSYCFFCPVCYRPLGVPAGVNVPRVELPLRVAVMLREDRQKSTGIHVKALAPAHVDVYDSEADVPNFDAQSTVVAFPSAEARPWASLEGLDSIKTLVVLCCPWQAPHKLLALPQMQGLRHVSISGTLGASLFWRVPSHDEGHVRASPAQGALRPLQHCALCPLQHCALCSSQRPGPLRATGATVHTRPVTHVARRPTCPL